MMSGYSIAASLTSRPDGYVLRRVRRIYPTYLAALALTVATLLSHPLHLPQGQVISLVGWKTDRFERFHDARHVELPIASIASIGHRPT